MALITPFTREGLRTDNRHGARILRNVDQSIPNGVYTLIEFNELMFQTGSMWDAASPTRLTVQQGGIYALGAAGQYVIADHSTVNRRDLAVTVNGVITANSATSSWDYPHLNTSTIAYLQPGDVIEAFALHHDFPAVSIILWQGVTKPTLWALRVR